MESDPQPVPGVPGWFIAECAAPVGGAARRAWTNSERHFGKRTPLQWARGVVRHTEGPATTQTILLDMHAAGDTWLRDLVTAGRTGTGGTAPASREYAAARALVLQEQRSLYLVPALLAGRWHIDDAGVLHMDIAPARRPFARGEVPTAQDLPQLPETARVITDSETVCEMVGARMRHWGRPTAESARDSAWGYFVLAALCGAVKHYGDATPPALRALCDTIADIECNTLPERLPEEMCGTRPFWVPTAVARALLRAVPLHFADGGRLLRVDAGAAVGLRRRVAAGWMWRRRVDAACRHYDALVPWRRAPPPMHRGGWVRWLLQQGVGAPERHALDAAPRHVFDAADRTGIADVEELMEACAPPCIRQMLAKRGTKVDHIHHKERFPLLLYLRAVGVPAHHATALLRADRAAYHSWPKVQGEIATMYARPRAETRPFRCETMAERGLCPLAGACEDCVPHMAHVRGADPLAAAASRVFNPAHATRVYLQCYFEDDSDSDSVSRKRTHSNM